MSLEHVRSLLLGHDIEPDANRRDMRLFFAVSWGLASSPAITPLLPDNLDSQLSEVGCTRPAVAEVLRLTCRCRPPLITSRKRTPRELTGGSCRA